MRLSALAFVGLIACGKVNPGMPDATSSADAPHGTIDAAVDAPQVHGTMMFATTGAITMFQVPLGVTSLKIEAWGAAGGDAGTLKGGAGAYATGTVTVTPGQMLSILVGAHGFASTDTMEQGLRAGPDRRRERDDRRSRGVDVVS
jgi:hypothetical protein